MKRLLGLLTRLLVQVLDLSDVRSGEWVGEGAEQEIERKPVRVVTDFTIYIINGSGREGKGYKAF